MVALAPDVTLTVPALEHMAIAGPATAVGPVVIVNVFVERTLKQTLSALNVIVTLPAEISAALGV